MHAGLAFGREWTVGGGTWACWLVATLAVGWVEDTQGTCDSGKRRQWRTASWEGPRSRDGWKEGLVKQLEKEQLEANWTWNRDSFKKREWTGELNRAAGPES